MQKANIQDEMQFIVGNDGKGPIVISIGVPAGDAIPVVQEKKRNTFK